MSASGEQEYATVKAISLWQPHASAVAVGAKLIETRHWATNYRGPIAIHAAKRKVVEELLYYLSCNHWIGALHSLGWRQGKEGMADWGLPFQAIVATANLVDCKRTTAFTEEELNSLRRPSGAVDDAHAWTEAQMGDFSEGRFGWVLADVKPLTRPIPYRGRQGLFEIPAEVLSIA